MAQHFRLVNSLIGLERLQPVEFGGFHGRDVGRQETGRNVLILAMTKQASWESTDQVLILLSNFAMDEGKNMEELNESDHASPTNIEIWIKKHKESLQLELLEPGTVG